MYGEASVVIDGALAMDAVITTDQQLLNIENNLDADRSLKDKEVRMYCLWHYHDFMVDCACMQLLQDHRPLKVWAAGRK